MVRTDAAGSARLTLPIPNLPSLSGLVLDAQAFVIAPGGAWQGVLDASRGLELTIGD